MNRPEPEIKLTKKKWVDDFLDDIIVTGNRLIQAGVNKDKVDKSIRKFVKEMSSDFYEINIKYY
jgi:hypothetical protein